MHKNLEEWDIGDNRIEGLGIEDEEIENPVGDCYREINHGLGDAKKVSNAIGGNRIENRH